MAYSVFFLFFFTPYQYPMMLSYIHAKQIKLPIHFYLDEQ